MHDLTPQHRNQTWDDLKQQGSYDALSGILAGAFDQAAKGKGHIHHSDGKPWEEQLMNVIEGWGMDYARGQAIKKLVESLTYFEKNGDIPGAIEEIKGAIIYGCCAIRKLTKEVKNTSTAGTETSAK